MAPIFLELGWYTEGRYGPRYHPVVREMYPHYQYTEDSTPYAEGALPTKTNGRGIWNGVVSALCGGENGEDVELGSVEESG
ncbi:hypothetical protein CYLTODRAFT_423361 [Cylindrobasidium torrendii FP15055 ss-10]|uniref:Uncharacterized protein n=1 Tax=Cylindrobasidium torrendii FP15055 ss-10 TaxID=1314674 RepID=A0A0D7B7N5_9AGAR|nr:hypothetical protein CYLTODRAFT_423361 [Cylindrobasidium torrendii FP15055 ss-10]